MLSELRPGGVIAPHVLETLDDDGRVMSNDVKDLKKSASNVRRNLQAQGKVLFPLNVQSVRVINVYMRLVDCIRGAALAGENLCFIGFASPNSITRLVRRTMLVCLTRDHVSCPVAPHHRDRLVVALVLHL